MRAIAGFIMRSRFTAITVVAAPALLPLLFWLSGAALALVALRRGPSEGALVMAGATLLLGVISAGLIGTPLAALQPLLLIWLPVLLLALVLRATVSLARTLETGALVAAAGVLVFHVLHPDPAAFWTRVLEQVALLMGGDPAAETWQRATAELAPMLTGLWAVNMLALAVASLLLGRWWQALLYNPGGFRAEFHELRLEVWFTGIAVAAAALALFTPAGLVRDLSLVLTGVFVLQALAVVHALFARRGWHGGWLVGVYLLLPLALRPVAALGIADVFLDLRRRFAGPSGQA
ncbi:hypothetical protein [Sediminicurvatus halobius]|uniref:DUF2232 domain-containing protein n=1 Tax=Sediminicurvatus halobius TaxID=2182432 RepID=A0A2U2MX49_9GAMM|nr:hypothetical protein [Spiribacter halobius]PWG61419.1 hypothetical protein DEM34_16415 [Spiribacter halobius]UEX76957.1 hypothetical protein LMH63_13510 [Spiribacter halobius]